LNQIEKADKWWRENREASPDALRDELENALRLIAVQPGIGRIAASAKLEEVRRIHLSRVHYHLYYRIRPDGATIEVLAFWHARRGRSPSL
jgi:plasmid stabilization system protein ParE